MDSRSLQIGPEPRRSGDGVIGINWVNDFIARQRGDATSRSVLLNMVNLAKGRCLDASSIEADQAAHQRLEVAYAGPLSSR